LNATRDVGVLVLAAVACFLHASKLASYAFEDAYITFRYADNLARGHGFVFNLGERVLGTSTPLYTLLLAGFRMLGLDPPAVAGVVYAICLSLTALGGWWILRRFKHPNLAALYAVMVLWGIGRSLHFFGMETTLYTALMFAALIAALYDRPVLTGLLTGLVCLTRYDGVVFAGVLLPLLWYRQRRFPWKAMLTAGAVTAPWFLFSWVYFGSPLPNTLGAKSGAVGVIEYMNQSLLRLIDGLFSPVARFIRQGGLPAKLRAAIVLLIVAPTLTHTIRTLRRERLAGTFLLYPVLLWLGYSLIAPPVSFRWYLLPGMLLLLTLCLLTWGEALSGASPRLRPVFAGAAAAMVGWSLWFLPSGVAAEVDRLVNTEVYRRRVKAYDLLAGWMTDHGLDDVKLLTHEPGYLSYITGNPVVDAAGLVTRDVVFHRTDDRQTPVNILVDRHRPGLLVLGARTWRGLGIEDFLPLYYTMPRRALYIRRDLLRERLSTLARTWLRDDYYYPVPVEPVRHPFQFDFDDGDPRGWWSSFRLRGFVGRPVAVTWEGRPYPGRYLHSHRPDKAGSLISPPFLIDFDELEFLFTGNRLNTRAELLVNGLPVLSVAGRPDGGHSLQVVRWPVSSWRGQVAILRFADHSTAGGFLIADRIRSIRGHDLVLFDDFEDGEYGDRWPTRFGDRPSPYTTVAREYGPQFIQGNYSAVSLFRGGKQELRSRPFTIQRDRIAFVVFDFGGRRTAVELWIDGEVVRRLTGSRSQALTGVVWDVSQFRGQTAELLVVDGSAGPARGIGIDHIVLYDVGSPTNDAGG
jgi:hypothetical protein